MSRKSKYNPPLVPRVAIFEKLTEMEIRNLFSKQRKHRCDNLTKDEDRVLRELMKNHNIRVMKLDKGGGVVIMDQYDFTSRMLRHLNNSEFFTPASMNEINIFNRRLDFILEDLFQEYRFTMEEIKFLKVEHPNVASFFGIPKIHKSVTDPQMRPIVAGRGSKTEPLAKMVVFI